MNASPLVAPYRDTAFGRPAVRFVRGGCGLVARACAGPVMRKIFRIASFCTVAGLAACTTAPGTVIQQPMTAKPQANDMAAVGDGAIFKAAAYRPMFEDRRPRMVGDTLTINISEKTSAGKTAANTGSKAGSVAFTVPRLFGVPASTTRDAGLTASTTNKFEEKGAESSSNTFTGSIGVTVIEVLPNGNLVVSGEKQIALDKGVEYIRLSGVVNPDTITAGNVVSSAQVADARVEYRTNTRIDMAEFMSQLVRLFMSVAPL